MPACSRLPRLWPSNRGQGHCDPCQIQALLRSRDKDAELDELYVSALHRRFDITTPWGARHVLGRYGVVTHVRFWSLEDFRANALVSLSRDCPIIFPVRHSVYLKHDMHYLGIWGADASSDEYNVYDSQSETSAGGDIGNVVYDWATIAKAIA